MILFEIHNDYFLFIDVTCHWSFNLDSVRGRQVVKSKWLVLTDVNTISFNFTFNYSVILAGLLATTQFYFLKRKGLRRLYVKKKRVLTVLLRSFCHWLVTLT